MNNPVDTVAKAFGGKNVVAGILGLHRTAINKWGALIPAKHQRPLLNEAKIREIPLTEKDVVEPANDE